ncbi:unnamed protein product, partial [Ixodes hexagonus]
LNYSTVSRAKEGSNMSRNKASKSPEVHVLIPSNLRRGDTAEIFCSLRRGSLPVAFRWLHNGRSIGDHDPAGAQTAAAAATAGRARNHEAGRGPGSGSGTLWKTEHRDRRSELLIENIGAHQIGNYTCVASNAAGKTSFTASLLVDVPPTWLESPGDRAAVVGSSLTLDCVALGHPTPVAKWTRIQYPSDSPIRDKDDRVRVLSNGSLSILNVEPEDSGLFRCDVENGVGATLTKTVNLTVSVPPTIRKMHQATKVRLGNIVKLHCSATGEGPLQITWTKDDKPIERTLRERYDVIERSFPGGIASDLLIHKSSLSDAGKFSCQVSNRFGAVTGERPLYVLGRGRKLSSSSVPGSETSTYLQDLQPGTEYSGHIVSQNDVGLSGPSVSMRFITSEEAPTAPPTDVHSTPVGEKEIMVTWKGPPIEHRNGKIQGYYVGYKVHNSALPYNYQTVTGGAESVVIKDLKPSTTYSVVVQAFNRAGQSPSSHQISVQPFVTGLPDPPAFSTSEVTCCSVILTITSRQKPTDSITRTWDEDGAVEEAEVPFYLRAGVLVPVAVSLGIIVVSVVAAFAYYRRSLATHGGGVKYESCVQSREPNNSSGSSWPAASRASFARRSIAESSVYDTPWDAQAALAQANQNASIYDGNYTRLKGRGSNSHLALESTTSADKNQ